MKFVLYRQEILSAQFSVVNEGSKRSGFFNPFPEITETLLEL